MTRLMEDAPTPRRTRRRPPWSRLATAVPGLAFVGGLALIAAAPGLQPPPASAGRMLLPADQGYRAAVGEMARLGLFRVESLPAPPGRPRRNTLVIDPAALSRAMASGAIGDCGGDNRLADCLQLFAAYRDKTFLGEDMARVNRSVWAMADGRVQGLRPAARSMVESGRDIILGGGRLLFRQGSPAEASVLVDVGSGAAFAGGGACPVPGTDLGLSATCLGDRLLLRLPREPAAGGIRLDGQPLVVPATAQGPALLLVRRGQVLALPADPSGNGGASGNGGERAWQIARRSRHLSEIGGHGERVRYRGFSALAAQVDGDALVRDLRTAIRKPLQDLAQRRLDAALAGVAKGRGFTVRGAVLLMDGLTGEIAAAATFPTLPAQIEGTRIDPGRRETLLAANQNFEPLEIGSTAKVPFYAAILPEGPALARPIPFTGSHCMDWPRFLRSGTAAAGSGCATPLGDPAHAYASGQVGVEQAIGYSNNFYAVSTLRAAYLLGSEGRERWLRRLDALACDDARGKKPREQDAACPIRPWQDAADPRRGRPLATVDIAFPPPDLLADPYGGLFLAILGNGDWKWSNVQLAQAYARLLSGREVRPRLLVSDQPLDEASPYRPVLRGAAWGLVRNGMLRVMSEGTARRSFGPERPPAVPGRVLLAKTGTPTLPDGTDGTTFVLAVAATKSGGLPRSPRDICALRLVVVNLQADRPGHGFVRDMIDASPALRRWLADRGGCPAARSKTT